jgi:uncharacterized protein
VCTQCRGVWLDRGELEKMAAAITGGPMAGGFLSPAVGQAHGADVRRRPDYDQRGRRDWDDDDDERRDHRSPRRKSFLDFFD